MAYEGLAFVFDSLCDGVFGRVNVIYGLALWFVFLPRLL